MVGEFPSLSETFILDQITGLLMRGHSVSILAGRRSPDAAQHPDVARFGLQELTRYENLPRHVVERAVRFPLIWRPTRPFVRALNVFRFGGWAASLRLAWAAHLTDGAADFDVIQCHFGASGVKAGMLREIGALRGRIVTAFHGEDITNYPNRFRRNPYKSLFAQGDLFLPISTRWNDALVALGCPPERIRTHRMGIDANLFPGRVDHSSQKGRALRILTVGRLVEKKGIADAILAAARLKVDFEYDIVGNGPLRAELETLARAHAVADKVRFHGAQTRDQIVSSLQDADVFLAPSVTARDGDIEGIPVSIMEAMASGLPVLSTRHSAIPDLVEDNVSGFLVEEHDVPALADRLTTLAVDPALRARMGSAGRRTVSREFEIGALNARLESHYRTLVGEPAAHST